jgi:hypothetical protein
MRGSFGSLRSVRDPSSPPSPRAEIAVLFESTGVEKEPFVVALKFFAHPEFS